MLYEVKLNWYGEVLTYYRVANSQSQALLLAERELEEELDLTKGSTFAYFENHDNSYEVKEIKKDGKKGSGI